MTHYRNSGGSWTSNTTATNTYWRAPATAPANAGYVDNRGEKGIYDPCPQGYRIAANGAYAGFPAKTWTMWDKTAGQTWLGVWWPAGGYRSYDTGTLVYAGYYGHVWSSSPQSYRSVYELRFEYNGGISTNSFFAQNLPVRCVQQ